MARAYSETPARPGREPDRQVTIGDEFHRLTVVAILGYFRSRLWVRCRCQCGVEVDVKVNALLTNNNRSCGCARREKLLARNTSHGHTPRRGRKSEYGSWAQLKQRCGNPNNLAYADYGGRGIRVCERWLNSFEAFLEDMGPKPSPDHSIERDDVNGHYEPRNCRWATDGEQANNTRRNRRFTLNGVTRTLSEWAAALGIQPSTLHGRLKRMSPERALTMPRVQSPRWDS